MSPDYIARIQTVKTRFEAATLIRAWATVYVVGTMRMLTQYSEVDCLAFITEAERHAQQLERGFEGEDGESCDPPWRRWLVEWGYIAGRSRAA